MSAPLRPSAAQKIRLREFVFFQSLNEQAFELILDSLELTRIGKSSVLFREGESSRSMFLLVEGTVDILRTTGNGGEYRVARIEAPTVIGELAYFTGAPRSASARAVESLTLAEIATPVILEIARHSPAELERFFRDITARLEQSTLLSGLQHGLGIKSAELLASIAGATRLRHVRKGEVIMRRGGAAEDMAVLISGRLGVRKSGVQSLEDPRMIAVYPGESVGEAGLLSEEQVRDAEVRALRDSSIGIISIRDFERFLSKDPDILLTIIRTILTRQNGTAKGPQVFGFGSERGSIALLQDDNEELRPLIERLRSRDDVRIIDTDSLIARFHTADILELPQSNPQWTRFVQANSDSILVFSRYTRRRADQQHRILEHLKSVSLDRATMPPLAELSDQMSLARIERLLCGDGRGLVLSGGGARGFAHIGVMRALHEAGISPDSLGGTSMGALIAASYALYDDLDVLREVTAQFGSRRRILDWTLPVSSLVSSKRVGRILRDIFGTRSFSDLKIPLFTLATDLSHSREEIFVRGELYDAVRASISIPGIFYPFIRDGHMFVDGGVMNNLPVDHMRTRIGSGLVYASDVSRGATDARGRYYQPVNDGISGIAQLYRRKISGSGEQIPAMADVFIRTFDANTSRRLREREDRGDVLFSIDVSGYDPLDFGRHRDIIQAGYDQARRQLEVLNGD